MKRIKNLLLAGALLASASFPAFSQFSVSFGTGYGFGLANHNLQDDININSTSGTYTSNKTSFGQGLPLDLRLGYDKSESLSFELGFSYLLGATETFTEVVNNPFTSYSSTTEVKARALRIVPALRLTVGEGKIRPYTRFGLSMGVINKLDLHYSETGSSGGTSYVSEDEYEMTGGISLGITSALGMNMAISDNLRLFAELNVFGQSWAPKRALLTKSTYNGVDELGNMTTSEKETEFEKEYTENYGNNSPGQPTKSTQIHYPMSSVGLVVGVTFVLGK